MADPRELAMEKLIGTSTTFRANAKRPVMKSLGEIVRERRTPTYLPGLRDVLERGVTALLAGPRSTFKSFIATHWALTAAAAGAGVAILSGEGLGLGIRVRAWQRQHAPATEIDDLPVVALEMAVRLTDKAVREAIVAAIEARGKRIDLLVIDTISKFAPDLEENSNKEVATFLADLADDIRDKLGCTVLLVAHSGHKTPQRARGASALGANTDAEYMVIRSGLRGMDVRVTRRRFKDGPELPDLAYRAEVVELEDDSTPGARVTSLALVDSELRPCPNVPLRGRNQLRGLEALSQWASTNPNATLIQGTDLTRVLKQSGLLGNRAKEVRDALIERGVIAAVGSEFTVNHSLLACESEFPK